MNLPSLLTTPSHPPLRMILTLVFAAAVAALFKAGHIPLPWMIGPLAATGIISVIGGELLAVPYGRQFGQAMVGIVIGLNLTHEVASNIFENVYYIVGMSIVGIAFGVMIAAAVSRLSSVPFRTSFFACMPGGIAEMAVLAEKHGGDLGYIALAHSIRVVAVVTLVAPGVSFLSQGGMDVFAKPDIPVDWLRFAAMAVSALLIAVVLNRFEISNAFFIGGLAIGGVTAYFVLPLSAAPGVVINLAQVLIGSALGLRLRRELLQGMKKLIAVMAASTAALIVSLMGVAWLLAGMMDYSFFTMVLSTAPGGLAEMSITASVFNLGVTMVAAFHCVRIVLVMILSGQVFNLLERAQLVPPR